MHETFSIKRLGDFDQGKVAAAFDLQLAAAVADCEDRPAVPKPRTVILEAVIEPVADQKGDLETVAVFFRMKSKGPASESRLYSMAVRRFRDGMKLVFNPDAPNDANASTIPLDPEDTE